MTRYVRILSIRKVRMVLTRNTGQKSTKYPPGTSCDRCVSIRNGKREQEPPASFPNDHQSRYGHGVTKFVKISLIRKVYLGIAPNIGRRSIKCPHNTSYDRSVSIRNGKSSQNFGEMTVEMTGEMTGNMTWEM